MKRSLVACVVGTIVVSVGALIAVLAAGWTPQLGLDLQGGASVVYKPAHPVSDPTLNQSIDIIRNRVDALGVAEPNIARQGDNIVVQLPGVKNPQRALRIIGETAQLYFRPVLCLAPPYQAPKGKPQPALTGPPPPCNSQVAPGGEDPTLASVPSTSQTADSPSSSVLLPQKGSNGTGPVQVRYAMGPSPLNGSAIKSANAVLSNSGAWQVNFTLTGAGSPKFDALASANYQKQVAIVLDGVVRSAPTINARSFGGQGQITGNFSQSDAQDLALVLNYGSLPVQLQQQTVQTISPTLGRSSLQAGLYAGLGGLALVMIYMIIYYRGLGIVVVLGLATTAALLWAIICLLGHTNGLTLDLSGVTGIIVSVGVTVDSYVVYFERLKDEVRSGKTIRTSVDRGFKRAYRTILAADAVSFLGALLLYLLSIGPVRGFAFFLGLSTLLDVFTAYLFTRPLVILLGRSRLFTEARWLGVAPGLALEGAAPRPKREPVGAGSRA